jgi:hypothetical protein
MSDDLSPEAEAVVAGFVAAYNAFYGSATLTSAAVLLELEAWGEDPEAVFIRR